MARIEDLLTDEELKQLREAPKKRKEKELQAKPDEERPMPKEDRPPELSL